MPVSAFENNAAWRRSVLPFFSGSECAQRSPLQRLILLLAVIGTLLLTADRARAFEALPVTGGDMQHDAANASPQWTASSRPATTDDECLPLLKSHRINYDASAMDRSQRSAGESSGIGIVIGVRFALGSGSKNKSDNQSDAPHLDIWQPSVTGDSQALAIADYNRCKGDHALKSLSADWRWSR